MWWAMGAVAVAGVVIGLLVRDIRVNRRRIARLENELAAIGEAERIIARAHHRRDRSHLKLLGLIPVGWLLGSRARLAVASAASAMVVGAGFTATDPPNPRTPPAAAETPETPAVVDTPVRAHGDPPVPRVPPSTTTTVAAPPAAATDVEEGVTSTTAPPPLTSPPSTTTTTTLPPLNVEVELPRPCLVEVPVDLHLCPS